MSAVSFIPPPFRATEKQREAATHWRDPACRRVLVGGAIRSGKTQAAGRLLVETALEMPSTYLVARLTYRELEDSTKKALLHGDGSLPPLIPPEAVDEYRVSDNLVRLKTGSVILFRSLDQPAKLLNLTLGGIFVDQIEELDPGEAGERIFDTMLGRLSDPGGPRKLIGVANPGPTTHWVYRRFVAGSTRDPDVRYVHIALSDNAENLPADYVAAMEATRTTRPHWYRSFVLGEWGAFEGQAYTEFEDRIHVVEPFEIDEDWHWERFESLDHGASNPTAWHAWAVDYDGNSIITDEYYSPGLVSAHAPEIARRRAAIRREKTWTVCYADPSVFANHGHSDQFGAPASIATEYVQHGIRLKAANNDRRAGHMRLLELIHVEADRAPPPWSRVPQELGGAPRLYIFRTCKRVIEQLKAAPVALDGVDAGEAVDPKWESAHGHAHASARYGAMSRPSPSVRPEPGEQVDPWAVRSYASLRRRRELRWQTSGGHDDDYYGRSRLIEI